MLFSKYMEGSQFSQSEVSLKDILLKIIKLKKYVISKWRIVLMSTLLGCLLGGGFAHFKKPYYTASTIFVLDNGDNGGVSQYAGLAAVMGISVGGNSDLFQGDNIFQLYKSRRMIEQTLLSKMSDHNDSLFIEKYIVIYKTVGDKNLDFLKKINFRIDPSKFDRTQNSIITIIAGDINDRYLVIDRDKKYNTISVQFKSRDESFAKDFNEQLVKNVNDFYSETKSRKAKENLVILQRQTDSVRSVLNGSLYQTAIINDITPNLNPTKQVLRLGAQKSQVNAEATKAVLSQLVQSLEVAKITARKETPLIQIIDTPVYPLPVSSWSLTKGIIFFGFITFVLTVTGLVVGRIYKSIIA